jgi:hypothetical protein
MRKLSAAAIVMILAIAAYFTIVWGLDALRVLTSPNYGLDDTWRSQFIFALGRLFGLGPVGLLKLAAFFGTLKLAVAVICAAHIAERALAFVRGKADAEILEGALILVVLISIASVGPAVWLQNADLVREGFVQLMLAAVATALCIVEKRYARQPAQEPAEAAEIAATPRGAPWFSPFR